MRFGLLAWPDYRICGYVLLVSSHEINDVHLPVGSSSFVLERLTDCDCEGPACEIVDSEGPAVVREPCLDPRRDPLATADCDDPFLGVLVPSANGKSETITWKH